MSFHDALQYGGLAAAIFALSFIGLGVGIAVFVLIMRIVLRWVIKDLKECGLW